MEIMRKAFVFVIAVAMVLGAADLTLAGRSGTEAPGAAPPIAVDPSARGKQFSGVLGAHYQASYCATCPEELGPNVSMTFFLRLETRDGFYPFGSAALSVCYWDFDAQWSAVQDFVKAQVIPFLHQQGVLAIPNACFAFKEVSKAVDDLDGSFTDPLKPRFSLLNFVLAVDDRTQCP